ncbi:MAG TPA: GNAT family N-acetyltransferase [Pseudonocardiaceae bacterium]|nr:GNAT family N-acetyltransferase [Pseudonocardiaceae bacterium]
MADVVIRPFRPADRDGIYDVCLRTADGGQDATALYRDPELVGDIFAGPYAYLEPDFAFVLDDGGQVTGYVLGAPDSTRFAEAMREKWLPLVGAKHPEPAGPPADRDEEMAYLLHHPELMVHAKLADYPAHLHIDLLPGYQRSGHGRRMMATLLTALHTAGVPAVHLAMLTTNTQARAFYDRLGCHEIDMGDDLLTYLGRSTAE